MRHFLKSFTPVRYLLKSHAAVLLLALTALPLAASAQIIGVEVGGTEAQYGEALVRPIGISGTVDLPLTDRLSLRLAASRQSESRGITRSPCTGLAPPGTDCSPEPFVGDAQLTTFGAGVTVALPSPIEPLHPELYALATGSTVDVTFSAEQSDEELQPITPDGPSWGLEVGAGLHYPITNWIAVSGRVGLLRPGFEACGDDGWFAFCETRTLPRFAIGTRFNLSAL